MKRCAYIGPADIKARVAGDGPGFVLRSCGGLEQWLAVTKRGGFEEVKCTFVADLKGVLRIADRHSEHVACAEGEAVLSAGEMTFTRGRQGWEVEAVTNQSTGDCPEPESWVAVAAALRDAGLKHPRGWTDELVFRRSERCGQRNIVKEGWFACDVCCAQLPREWNFVDVKTRPCPNLGEPYKARRIGNEDGCKDQQAVSGPSPA